MIKSDLKPSECNSNEATGNGNFNIPLSNDQTPPNQPEGEDTDGGHSTSVAELQGSGNPASSPLQTERRLSPSYSSEQNVLPILGEDPAEGSQQDSLEPHFDELQASSDSHDSSSTNPEHDQSASQTSQSEGGELCGYNIK